MPRNASNIYSKPPGTTPIVNDDVDPVPFNLLMDDIATDLNTPRPIVAGGTGASSAAAALVNLGLTATAAEINTLDGITATTAELNILDGVTATAAELNILDGLLASTAELNILDGVTATAAELNILDGVTSTTAELNILDGVTVNASQINAAANPTRSIGGDGYITFPGGLILQWGAVTASSSGATATFPIAFPNNVFRVIVAPGSTTQTTATFQGLGLSSVFIQNWTGSASVHYFVLGN